MGPRRDLRKLASRRKAPAPSEKWKGTKSPSLNQFLGKRTERALNRCRLAHFPLPTLSYQKGAERGAAICPWFRTEKAFLDCRVRIVDCNEAYTSFANCPKRLIHTLLSP